MKKIALGLMLVLGTQFAFSQEQVAGALRVLSESTNAITKAAGTTIKSIQASKNLPATFFNSYIALSGAEAEALLVKNGIKGAEAASFRAAAVQYKSITGVKATEESSNVGKLAGEVSKTDDAVVLTTKVNPKETKVDFGDDLSIYKVEKAEGVDALEAYKTTSLKNLPDQEAMDIAVDSTTTILDIRKTRGLTEMVKGKVVDAVCKVTDKLALKNMNTWLKGVKDNISKNMLANAYKEVKETQLFKALFERYPSNVDDAALATERLKLIEEGSCNLPI